MSTEERLAFWKRPFRLFQPNLRKIDAKNMKVEELVDQAASFGANVMLINGGGIVAWYPTDHPYQTVNEYMDFDYLGEVLQAAHARGMKVLVRMDVSKSFPRVLEEHPDWFRRTRDGEVPTHWDMLQTCPSGPYWEEYNFKVVGELLERYEIDGIFYNAYNYNRCYCQRCKQKFLQATGYEIPENENWDDPAWRAFVQYRYAQLSDYTRRLSAFIAEQSPGTVLTIDTRLTDDEHAGIREAGWHEAEMAKHTACITAEAFNFLDRPFPRWIYWAGEEVKLGSHFSHTAIILSHSKTIFHRRAAQPPAQIGYDLIQIAANGGSPAIAFSGDSQQHDRKALESIRHVMTFLADHAQEYEQMKPIAQVAVVYSKRTVDYYGRERSSERWQHHYRGMYEMMVENHTPFTVLHEARLTEEDLTRYACIALPNIAILSDEAAAELDRYVEGGGRLIVTGETGFYDQDGYPRKEGNILRCLSGFALASPPVKGTYWTIEQADLFSELQDTDLLMGYGDLVAVPTAASTSHTEDLAIVPPLTNTTPEFSYWETTGEHKGLHLLRHGQGGVAYLPWAIDKGYYEMGIDEYRSVIDSLIRDAIGELLMDTDAPRSVEVTIARREAGGFLIHLLNATGRVGGKPLTETIPLHLIRLRIRGSWQEAIALHGAERITLEQKGAYTELVIPKLNLFEAIVLQ
ncbi:hypothetical protein DUZ99_17550 [Xylanibacillus composti]|uniref:Beta-galactosidase trimerization domain-containing protein n=1 Tax=Xylanibacillus composti TaxID=1572762 RepID=A0A8J4GXY6_9BACL|nr:alpha-amylase family protein [Xylanibacillus composti]MDT9726786.1 hypothetical protein [Xylanibacillus composti]GIQ67232.1 beta-galactosidase trimerization domain-containing protein [Xylanibacillus composti]